VLTHPKNANREWNLGGSLRLFHCRNRPWARAFCSMPRSDEAESFFTMVYLAVQEIPRGRVTSYGHIAKLIGRRKLTLCFTPSFAGQQTRNGSGDEKYNLTLPLTRRLVCPAECPRSVQSPSYSPTYGAYSGFRMSVCRQVGTCLKYLPSATTDPDVEFHSGSVPWQRVINSKGVISPR
jgi:alkylated DNA nucleotide flippase Atl1